MERFDADTFAQNKLLSALKTDTYPTVAAATANRGGAPSTRFHLGRILSTLLTLRTLSVRVLEERLDDQLLGSFHSKLKEVEITGENLRYVREGAFKGVERAYDLVLRIRDTKIEDFPAGLFEGVQNMAHLSLDFSRNRLVALSPAVLYSNITDWESVGTRLLDGK